MDYFKQLPVLNSDRIRLRPIQEMDTADINNFTSKDETVKFLGWEPHTDFATTKKFIHSVLQKYNNNEASQWAIELKQNGVVIGITGFIDYSQIHLKGEIAFVMSPEYQGHGYMTEANKLVLEAGFSHLNLNRIQAKAELENFASQHVLEKIGMVKEGILREFLMVKGTLRSYIMYSVLKREFKNY